MQASLALPTDSRFIMARAAVAHNVRLRADKGVAAVDDALELRGLVLHFARDREIYAEGEETRAFYKVVRGVVRTCRFLGDGHRQIDAFYLPGEMFGVEIGLEHRLSAEAASDCALISCRLDANATFGGNENLSARQLFFYAMRSLKRAQEHTQLLCHRSAVQRLTGFLLDLADRMQDQKIELPMTRRDIADYLGLTIETVSRTLSQLERQSVIAIPAARRILVTDGAKLRRLSE